MVATNPCGSSGKAARAAQGVAAEASILGPMPELKPDHITVQATFEEDVAADRAEIELVVAGSSFFSGREALDRAVEVKEVVEILKHHEVADDDIVLRDVTAETQKGMFSDSSSARYTLRATCRRLDTLADVLAAASKPKHTTLQGVTWKFPDDPELENARLAKAIARANRKADILADGLGVRILGVLHGAFDAYEGGSQRLALAAPMAAAGAVRRRETVRETLDMTIEHTQKAGVSVRIDYRVSGRGA